MWNLIRDDVEMLERDIKFSAKAISKLYIALDQLEKKQRIDRENSLRTEQRLFELIQGLSGEIEDLGETVDGNNCDIEDLNEGLADKYSKAMTDLECVEV